MARKHLAVLLTLMAGVATASAAVTPLHEGWRLESACKLQAGGTASDGAAIAAPGYPVSSWLKATVPSTVLAAQVTAGLFPNPYFGMNLRKIPGTGYPVGENFSNLPMPEDSPYKCGWWYRTTFRVSSGHGQRVWIHFGGINYRADVWLNGKKVADSTQVAGAYRTYDLDVTQFVNAEGENVLAVETFAPTENELGMNWVDWNPAPPDKDMGLWGPVRLVTTGDVSVRSPMAVTHFTDTSLQEADLTVYAELHNGADHAVRGVVSGTAAGVAFEQPVELAAHEDRTVVFKPEQFAALRFHNPKPWWPYQMGDPHLERLTVSFRESGITTDEQTREFGFREITSELTATGARLFRVNGKAILIRGGGWSPDMMLRENDTRLREQMQMVRDMHLNALRLEGKMESDEFFRLTDEDGILVMAGWCCCDHWELWKTWKPGDLEVATASLQDQIMRLRSHPSLLVWLNGSDNAPPANVEKAYLEVEATTHWPNPTLASASTTDTANAGPSGVKMTGPYDYVPPSYWYVDTHHGGGFNFNTETSPGPAVPSLASRKTFLSDPDAWPPGPDWDYHAGGGGFMNLNVMNSAMAGMYAAPESAAEYTRMAQTMAYDSERAMFEAYGRSKYVATGVIQWMLNNAWPSLIWHLYDYNLDPDAGYYATKKACEPLHIQYSYDDRGVVVVNSTYSAVEGLHASVTVHGLGWKPLFAADATVRMAADSSQEVFLIPDALYRSAQRIFFIDLRLTDAAGKPVSHNFYWVPGTLSTLDWMETQYTTTPIERYVDLTPLTQLPAAQIQATAEIEKTAAGRMIRLHLKNSDAGLAFQVHAEALTADGGLIAPVLWSDDWIELMPGEETTLTAVLPAGAPAAPVVHVDGWNVAAMTITPTAAPAGGQ